MDIVGGKEKKKETRFLEPSLSWGVKAYYKSILRIILGANKLSSLFDLLWAHFSDEKTSTDMVFEFELCDVIGLKSV